MIIFVNDKFTEEFQVYLFQGHDMVQRVFKGFGCLRQAVKLAPEVWTAMLLRMALKPEVHKFTLDIISALAIHFRRKIPESFWVCISKYLHKSMK